MSRLRAAAELINDITAINKRSKVLTQGDGDAYFQLVKVTLEKADKDNSTVCL